VTEHSGIVTDDSGHSRKIGHLRAEWAVTFGRNGRSHSNGISGQIGPEYAHEVALRRRMLNLRPRKGRWPFLTEGQESTLWEQWRSRVKAGGIMQHEHTAMLNVAMELAETHCLPLSVVWNAIRDWVKQNGSNKA